MEILSLFLIAVSLSMDAFAIAVTSGILERDASLGKILKLAFFFGFFQFAMPLLGYLLGVSVIDYIQTVDHWVAFGLLAFLGGRMVLESQKEEEDAHIADPFSTKTLLVMAVATSIDALAVGVSFAMAGMKNIFSSCLCIGVVTFLLSAIGVRLGERVGELFKKGAALLGGVCLITIGLKILLEHIF